jgi:ubiquinone/menaquinone biosynthesis C-methylase UbiE
MYSPKDYWATLAEGYDLVDESGFAPVLHPHAPAWFNQIIDNVQFHALRRALTIATIPPGARFLDVGCGTGRWIRRYKELGFSPVGVDATIGMLRIARARKTDTPLTVGLAYCLPFSNAVFDCISDVTVVQHIPHELQQAALEEMVRVLKPGGRMILLELVRGRDSHIFPRQPQDWIREVESCGTTLIKCFGQEYFFPDRLFVHIVQSIFSRSENAVDQTQSTLYGSSSDNVSLVRRAYWQFRRITVSISVWIEKVVTQIFPPSMATHAVFVFRKKL